MILAGCEVKKMRRNHNFFLRENNHFFAESIHSLFPEWIENQSSFMVL